MRTRPTASGKQPQALLELYEFEACPFCRRVREVMSELDLEYIARVAPRGSGKREELRARGGKPMVPYLIDSHKGVEMYEAMDIIHHLYATYGDGKERMWPLLNPLNTLGSRVASGLRPRGRRALVRRARQPGKLLDLFNYEASPSCRKVREVLNELDLDYRARNVAKGSARRRELVERGGKMQVPYLMDANTGSEMYESDDIVAYLRATYDHAEPTHSRAAGGEP